MSADSTRSPIRVESARLVAFPSVDTALLTFGGQPQCRTPARLEGSKAVPIEGVTVVTGERGAFVADTAHGIIIFPSLLATSLAG